jgi:hypothetical protein
MSQPLNLIPVDNSTDLAQLLSECLLLGLSCQDILDRLRAEFSNMSVEKLYRHVEESYLLQVLTILNQLVLSGIIHDMDVGGGR